MDVCANCGREGGDGVRLKNCTACLLVKYCSVDCQKAHRKQHKGACKKRAAELKDERLYSQGHERSEREFCPICTLPIPLPISDHSGFFVCCMKSICNGCFMAARKRGLSDTCPFCRTPLPKNDADKLAMVQARVSKKDPAACHFLGLQYCHGRLGLQKDMRKAFEKADEAAELGSISALFDIGVSYTQGIGVEADIEKGVKFFEKGAMQGCAECRYTLGIYEGKKRNYGRAVRHWMISANMGHENSLENIKKLFMNGAVTKEQYTEALRGYQVAVEETKSHEREEAKKLEQRK